MAYLKQAKTGEPVLHLAKPRVELTASDEVVVAPTGVYRILPFGVGDEEVRLRRVNGPDDELTIRLELFERRFGKSIRITAPKRGIYA